MNAEEKEKKIEDLLRWMKEWEKTELRRERNVFRDLCRGSRREEVVGGGKSRKSLQMNDQRVWRFVDAYLFCRSALLFTSSQPKQHQKDIYQLDQ